MDEEELFSPMTTSSQMARDDDEEAQRLARLLADFDKKRRNDRRLKFQAIVSHGEKLAKTYQQQVSKVFEQAEEEMEKRVEQHRQNEARVTSEIRTLEKKLLELIAARSDTIQSVAEAVSREVTAIVTETRKHAEAVSQVAEEEGKAIRSALDQLWTAAAVDPAATATATATAAAATFGVEEEEAPHGESGYGGMGEGGGGGGENGEESMQLEGEGEGGRIEDAEAAVVDV
ncbi:hypothetical protein C6P46_001864 [Rhodotorula mucilaginosa]|uniref:Uncharacterized protein n=1 Tax=Rhodotorula mucilaginosa TaxID=5537 RepID=A0A9P6VUJ5_RHOMI|nr:hypothetical protein C6P46_001864 [Rhodotorula mucilaginosa]TKA52854.1 hypothetical protein B0A53_04550 [Rhodotorula sp. CCFEE 5036]